MAVATVGDRSSSVVVCMKSKFVENGDTYLREDNAEVVRLRQENAHLKNQLAVIGEERDTSRNSLRELQELHDFLIIMFNRILQNQALSVKTESQELKTESGTFYPANKAKDINSLPML